MAPQPVVLEVQTIHNLVQHVQKHHAPPSTLVVCSSKNDFLLSLQTRDEGADPRLERLISSPTLRLLSTSRTLQLAFCPDITHLRAYLATYSVVIDSRSQEPDTALRLKSKEPMLVILNPVQLHRNTSAFSAQGLNRTFSVAIEAADSTKSKLILAELPSAHASDEGPGEPSNADPWDEEVSILNVTTKRLGELSVGRTVQARSVAARWCTFEKLPQPEHI